MQRIHVQHVEFNWPFWAPEACQCPQAYVNCKHRMMNPQASAGPTCISRCAPAPTLFVLAILQTTG